MNKIGKFYNAFWLNMIAGVSVAILLTGVLITSVNYAFTYRLADIPSLATSSLSIIGTIATHLATRIAMIMAGLGILCFLACYYCAICHCNADEDAPKKKAFGQVIVIVFFSLIVLLFVAMTAFKVTTTWLRNYDQTTIQDALDETLSQENLSIVGELGFYGGLLEDPESGARAYYVCRSIDNYGPFSFEALVSTDSQPFLDGYEQFQCLSNEGTAASVAMRRYDDGYWVVVKRFSSIEKLEVEINDMSDLKKYILQLEFTNHSLGNRSEASLLSELEYCLDNFDTN